MPACHKIPTLNTRAHPAAWEQLANVELLDLQVRELGLSIQSAGLQGYVARLHRELRRKGFVHFKPRVYLGDEWFCPGGAIAIAVPFYLAHPRLTRLEKRYKRRVEGDTPDSFMQLMRHEAGHAFDHAFGISDTACWRKIFGDKNLPYRTERYPFDPHSRDFVTHLADHYAQAHPEEDFAETFAVYMTPGLSWRRRYRNCPGAMRKLEFVDQLVRTFKRCHPRKEAVDAVETFHAARLRRTLGRHYKLS